MRLIAFVLIVLTCTAHAEDQPAPSRGESAAEYVQRYDAWLSTVPNDEKAWELIQEVEAAIQEEYAKGNEFVFHYDPESDYEEDRIAWEWTQQYVRGHPELIQKIHLYTARPYLGSTLNDASHITNLLGDESYTYEGSLCPRSISDINPEVFSLLRTHIFLIQADMYIANEEQNAHRVLRGIRSIIDLARMVRVFNSYDEHLLAQAIEYLALNMILEEDFNLSYFDDEQLRTLLDILRLYDETVDWFMCLEHERVASEDYLDWIYESSVDGRAMPQGLARFFDSVLAKRAMYYRVFSGEVVRDFWVDLTFATSAIVLQRVWASEDEQRGLVDSYYRALEKDLEIPVWEVIDWSHANIIQPRPEYIPAVNSMNGFQNLLFNVANRKNLLNAACLRLQIQHHKAKHGKFPSSISDLEGQFNEDAFIDQYSGDLLRYSIVDGKPLIYSVGTDRDDDGGRPMLFSDGRPAPYAFGYTIREVQDEDPVSIDGDWILYPLVAN